MKMVKKNFDWLDDIQKTDLDLGGLNISKFDSVQMKKTQSKREINQAEYKEKYGDNWFEKWWADHNPKPDYDPLIKSINECIYSGVVMTIRGTDNGVHNDQIRVFERMHEIYGDQYAELEVHAYGDSDVKERLLQDAIRTGKWKELPDCLQDEYHTRTQNK